MSTNDIYDFTTPYEFNLLKISAPIKGKTGGHVMKFSVNNGPVYMQPPKCYLKSGFVKSGKNMYCDLLFGIENENFMSWVENLEKHCVSKIYEKRNEWLDTDTILELEDMQNYLQPVGKSYKSGTMYIIRTTIPTTTLGVCDLKIYDENENEMKHDMLQENMSVITILELKGLHCTSHSFQFWFELKQMLLSPEKSFNKCLIKASKPDTTVAAKPPSSQTVVEQVVQSPALTQASQPSTTQATQPSTTQSTQPSMAQASQPSTTQVEKIETKMENKPEEKMDTSTTLDKISNSVNSEINVSEVEFDLAEIEKAEEIHLKSRDDVYFKMYREARKKAKDAKIVALSNYLEAKRIKTTYLSDMDLDSESDEEYTNDLEELAYNEY